MRVFGLALAALLGFTACCADVQLTRRYKSLQWKTDDAFRPAELTLRVMDAAPAEVKTVPLSLQLSDHGQAALIQSFASNSKGDQLIELLARPLPRKPASGDKDLTRIDKQLIFSMVVDKASQGITQADRIESLSLHFAAVSRSDADFEFLTWDRFGTEYGVVELGTIANESNRSFSAKLAPTFGGELVGTGEIGTSASNKTTESLVLKERTIKISGILSTSEGEILQEGGLGLDMTGNTAINLTFRLKGDQVSIAGFEGLFQPDGKPKGAAEVSPAFRMERRPRFREAAGLELESWAEYEFRHVDSGAETVIEGDDDVALYRCATLPTRTRLIDLAELARRARYFQIGDESASLAIGSTSGKRILRFSSKSEAELFRAWLKETSKAMKPTETFTLGTGSEAAKVFRGADMLTAGEIDQLESLERTNGSVPEAQ